MTDKELIKQEIERRFNDNMEASEQYTEDSNSHALFTSAAKEDYDLLAFIESLPKESANKDLEEEINKVEDWYPVELKYIQEIARHFVEWQKQQMKEALQTEYEKGRFDMREEMMKDAVEGEVVYKIGNAEIAPTDVRYKVMSDRVYIPNVKLGDKVKIIICKTEQQ